MSTIEQTVVAYGVRVTLMADGREALDALLAGLPGQWRPSRDGRAERVYLLAVDHGRDAYALYRDDFELVRTAELERVVEHLVGSVGFYFAEHSQRCTFIHAAAVAWQGRAILIPGKQRSGKTTLTAALVRAGATYLSDDYAPIDDSGHVHPFPRPLSVRRENGLPPRMTRVEEIGGFQGTAAHAVGMVVFAPYRARRWAPRRLEPGKAVLELLAHTASAQTRPSQAFDRLSRVVTTAPVLKGGRGEAEDAARQILKRTEKAIRENASIV